MSLMTDTNEQKWKEESKEIWKIYRYGDGHSFGHLEALEMGYLAARKKAHSENEDAFKAFTLDLVDRHEKEIQSLKAMIVECRPWIEDLSSMIDLKPRTYETLEQWLTKTENIRVE